LHEPQLILFHKMYPLEYSRSQLSDQLVRR